MYSAARALYLPDAGLPLLYMLGHRRPVMLLVSCCAFGTAICSALKDALCALRPQHAARVLSRVQDALQKSDAPDHAASSQHANGNHSPAAHHDLAGAPEKQTRPATAGRREAGGAWWRRLQVDLSPDGDHEQQFGAPSLHALNSVLMAGTTAWLWLAQGGDTTPPPPPPAAAAVTPTAHQQRVMEWCGAQGGGAACTAGPGEWARRDVPLAVLYPACGAIGGGGEGGEGAALGSAGWAAVLALGLLWSVWVALTRVHLGVHSPVDTVLGAGMGWALLAAWLRLGDAWLAWLARGRWAAVGWQLLADVVALSLFPRPLLFSNRCALSWACLAGHLVFEAAREQGRNTRQGLGGGRDGKTAACTRSGAHDDAPLTRCLLPGPSRAQLPGRVHLPRRAHGRLPLGGVGPQPHAAVAGAARRAGARARGGAGGARLRPRRHLRKGEATSAHIAAPCGPPPRLHSSLTSAVGPPPASPPPSSLPQASDLTAALLSTRQGRLAVAIPSLLLLVGLSLAVSKAVLKALLPPLLAALLPGRLRRAVQPPASPHHRPLEAVPLAVLVGPEAAGQVVRQVRGALEGAAASAGPGGPAFGGGEASPERQVHPGDPPPLPAGAKGDEGKGDGVLRRKGYPLDADACRRFVCYGVPVWLLLVMWNTIEGPLVC